MDAKGGRNEAVLSSAETYSELISNSVFAFVAFATWCTSLFSVDSPASQKLFSTLSEAYTSYDKEASDESLVLFSRLFFRVVPLIPPSPDFY